MTPPATTGVSGPGNSYIPTVPASVCSMANKLSVARLPSTVTATSRFNPSRTAA